MPQPLTLTTPGRWGVNEQERNQLLHPNWATKADGLVINDSGNLQCRGALNLISTDGAPTEILRQFVYVNSAGNEVVISTTATKIISGTADLDDASTDITPTGAPTNGFWQFQNFNGKVVGWQASHTPIVWSGSGDFAVITAASGTLPDGDCVLAAWGRLWAVDDDGQTIRYCALLDETLWHADDGGGAIDMRNVWPKGMDRVVALAAFGGNLVVFGRRSIVIYTDGSGSATGVDPTQMYVVDTIEGTGCVCRDSVTVVGEGDLLFLAEVGLQTLGRVIAQKDNPLDTISWQIADRLSAAIQSEIASATDLRTWTGSYIPATGQYMLTHTTTEDVYAFHYGGRAQDDKGRLVVPVTIFDTSILLNIRGFVTRRSGITYVTGGATHEIYQYDTSLALDEGDVAIAVDFNTGWLDLGGDISQVLKMLKMVQITVLNEAGIDSALTLKYATDYSPDLDSLTPLLTQDEERCIFLYDPHGDVEGQYFKFGFTDTSFGLKELTQIMAQFKLGRTAFIHKNFNDVVDESYVAATPPTISSLDPASEEPGAGAFTMTITGTGFNVDSVAYWEGEARVTTFVSATELDVAVLAGDVDEAGEFDVTVRNLVGGESDPEPFTVEDPTPVRVVFTASDTWQVPAGVTSIEILAVGGGGGGGDTVEAFVAPGGGGGGQVAVDSAVTVTPLDTLTITVGAGGAAMGGSGGLSDVVDGGMVQLLAADGGNAAGGTGGDASGGGGDASPMLGGAGGAGGNDGGDGFDAGGGIGAGGGGGGAGTAGGDGSAGPTAGSGGNGITPAGSWGVDIGEGGVFGGGGAGASFNGVTTTPGTRGTGGGAANTGGGGNGNGNGSGNPGYDGIVVIRYIEP